jgi:Raf kinase inhibitor-like YbhB/YbcL family protein
MIQVSSSAFREGEMIPRRYTCDGAGISPPLSWTGVPAEAQSLALVCSDPDAPRGTFTHWVVYNLPPDLTGLPEGVSPEPRMENGGEQGVNTTGATGYVCPGPPSGQTHRYIFTVYALDTHLSLTGEPTRAALEQAMRGHILAQGQLMGRYARIG